MCAIFRCHQQNYVSPAGNALSSTLGIPSWGRSTLPCLYSHPSPSPSEPNYAKISAPSDVTSCQGKAEFVYQRGYTFTGTKAFWSAPMITRTNGLTSKWPHAAGDFTRRRHTSPYCTRSYSESHIASPGAAATAYNGYYWYQHIMLRTWRFSVFSCQFPSLP